jgi:hypothetical protein
MTPARRQPRLWLSLALMLLMVRALVPAGWMPAQQRGQWITICSGAGVTMAWIGADGKIDKNHVPAKTEKAGYCAFAGLGMAVDLSLAPINIATPAFVALLLPTLTPAIAIGHGLAAPPPPKTGPPALI